MSGTKTAELYRMVMEDHLCPYGLKSKHLLETQGFQVEDHHLKNHEETEAFKGKRIKWLILPLEPVNKTV